MTQSKCAHKKPMSATEPRSPVNKRTANSTATATPPKRFNSPLFRCRALGIFLHHPMCHHQNDLKVPVIHWRKSLSNKGADGTGWNSHFLVFWGRLNCENIPVIPAWLVRSNLDEPRGIPYLI